MSKNNLRVKVCKVPTKNSDKDLMIELDTSQIFIYRIEVVGNYAYIFYDNRL